MQQMIQLLEANITYIIIGLIGISALFFILIIILFVKNKKLKKKYNEFMRGSEIDIESLLRESIGKSTQIQESYQHINDTIDKLQIELKKCVQKIGVVRYSAVPGAGAELSFAVALLDEEDNGVVINGIYTREGSYTYAKEMVAGQSKHQLSDEENEAITIAKQSKTHI